MSSGSQRDPGSEVEQEPQRTSDGEQRFVVDHSERSNESMIGYRLDVLALRVADRIKPRCARVELDVRRQSPRCRGARNDDHDAGGTLVEPIRGHDYGGSTSGLFPADRFTEVNEPDLAPPRAQLERSPRDRLSPARSASISAQASRSCRSSAYRVAN